MSAGCAAGRPAPRLGVIIVVDMLPTELFARASEHFGERGFKRLMNDGAWFTNARFSYGVTLTGPGHATIVTGTNPAGHGIVANGWYKPPSDLRIHCVQDENHSRVGASEGATPEGKSPHFLEVPTLGDALKERYGDSAQVWAFALKDRAAVLLGGKSADGAVWWQGSTSRFLSSTHYFDQLPHWCEQLNEERFADRFFNTEWDRLLPEEAYRDCDADNVSYEAGASVLWTNKLPKILGKNLPFPSRIYYAQLSCSPAGNELVFELARQAVSYESLGADDVTDLLAISLSSVDICGHSFGPNSHEMLDMMVRTDRQIESFLDFLEEMVGLDQCTILLTGDHGVGPIPERSAEKGLDAGRFDLTELFETMHQAMTDRYGSAGQQVYYVTAVNLPWVYLNEPLITWKGIDLDEAARVAAEAAKKHEGIEDVVTMGSLKGRSAKALSPLERAVANSAYEGRSGHLYLHHKPHWFREGTGCGHGSAHEYDTRVPVMMMGDGIRPGKYDTPIEIRDVAVTFAATLGIKPPSGATGRVFRDALEP